MKKMLHNIVETEEVPLLKDFLFNLPATESGIILQNQILQAFRQYVNDHPDYAALPSSQRFLKRVQEAIHNDESIILIYRLRKASCRVYRLSRENDDLVGISMREFLQIKERLVKPQLPYDQRTLEIDMSAFYDYGPSLKDPDSIGNGIKHLNRYMSANLSNRPEKWTQALYEFLKLHHLQGMQLLLDGNKIHSVSELESAIEDVIYFLDHGDCPDDLTKLKEKLKRFGFLDGWGDCTARILETVQLLQDILEQPNETVLEEFLSRVPMVSKAALISPHGWFGQHNVLGRPDTGGQVVYVLDQARALEKFMRDDLKKCGLDICPKILIVTRLIPYNEGTTSDQRLEKVDDSENVWILRVPFKYPHSSEIVPHWVSRFKIWPYLDQFAVDAENEILSELGGLPDLIVGNYSDGNLVASLLSRSLGVTQCNIAHALEKSKYLFSDLYWGDFEQEYHFSIQFMADLISMNLANFIISSTSQEITGTDHSIGQYESYQFFTMPGLMHVVNGINLFHPRFNVIPPGVSNKVFFPYTRKAARRKFDVGAIEQALFYEEGEQGLGQLANPDLPPIFSIARLDRIKNLTGLVEAFGQNEALRRKANLIIIASVLNPDASQDAEEAAEIRKMHGLIEQYGLHSQLRWVGRFLPKAESGEVYRLMADRRGVFVQPALFEAFGLTILEAMHSGLPVFATQFGGPLEIIVDKKSGFYINPTDKEGTSALLLEFFERCENEKSYWQTMSKNGLKRAQERFTWGLHCEKLTRLAKVHGFWRYSTSSQAKGRMMRYCDLLYHLYYKPRALDII